MYLIQDTNTAIKICVFTYVSPYDCQLSTIFISQIDDFYSDSNKHLKNISYNFSNATGT